MKNQKPKYLLIGIAAFVCMILFGLGGYNIGRQKQFSFLPISTAADTVDNWKTYTNSRLGLTFKYPQNWIDPTVRPQSTHTEISFDPSDANLSLIIGFDYNQTTGKNFTYSETISSATANLKSQEDFLLDGIKGKKIIYTMGASTLDILYIVPVPNESVNILKIQYTIPHGDPDTSKLFDQILSTFKFITPATIDTSSWKSYVNNEFGISFLYPADQYTPLMSKANQSISIKRIHPEGVDDLGPIFIGKSFGTTIDSLLRTNETTDKTSPGSFFSDHFINKITFQGFPAYLIKQKSISQVPTDMYVVQVKNDVYSILFESDFPVVSDPAYKQFNDTFDKNTKPVIEKTLGSIKFL